LQNQIRKAERIQLFVASHSENILKTAIEQGDWLIIQLYRDENKIIQCKRIEQADRRLSKITFAEIQYLVFDIVSRDYHNELYGYLQNKLNIKSVKGLDDWIVKQKDIYSEKYERKTQYKREQGKKTTEYRTICTYIRNEIDHPPESGITFSEEQLKMSIKLLRNLSLIIT